MNRKFGPALIAATFWTASAGLALAAEKIDCPQQQARRTITNQLPAGWWTTPVIDRLSETKIMTIGGKPTLVCVYGNAGSIQREAPRGKTCRAVTAGFVCK